MSFRGTCTGQTEKFGKGQPRMTSIFFDLSKAYFDGFNILG